MTGRACLSESGFTEFWGSSKSSLYGYDVQVLQALEVSAIVGEQCELMVDRCGSDEQVKIGDESSFCPQSSSFACEYSADGFIEREDIHVS